MFGLHRVKNSTQSKTFKLGLIHTIIGGNVKKRLVAFISSFALIFSFFPSAVSAAPSATSIALYFSAPFVTGSHVTDSASTETFNSFSTCPTTWAVGTASVAGCVINAVAGTSTGSSEQAIGVPLTNYLGSSGSLNTTVTFSNPVKYVGFWWMMGSNGNTVNFLDENNQNLASLTSSDIMNFLGVSYGSLTNSDTGTVNTVDGGTHLRKYYYRSPGNYTGTVASPIMNYDVDNYANEPWVYLNLFVSGNMNVKKVNFSGSAFEIDNLTVSTIESGPRGDMVLVKNVLGTPPTGQAMTWAPTNTTVSGGNNQLTPNNLATVVTPATGGGAITYSVISAGTSGCTVDSATGVITYTGAGECIVRATAAATSSYYTTFKDTTFTFQSAPTAVVTPPVAPQTASTPSVIQTASQTPVLASTGAEIQNAVLSVLLILFGSGFGFVAFRRLAK